MGDIVIHDGPVKKGKKKAQQNLSVLDGPPKSNVVYVGRIPHGFYEKQMRSFFEQFGNISKLRISRCKKTGKSKHFGFIQFEVPEKLGTEDMLLYWRDGDISQMVSADSVYIAARSVAAIVAESMNNYLLFESMLQVKLVPVEKHHPKMWQGANRVYQPGKVAFINRMRHNRVRNPVEQKRLLQSLVKKDRLRRQKLKAVGIDFDYPDIRKEIPGKSKKIVFAEEE